MSNREAGCLTGRPGRSQRAWASLGNWVSHREAKPPTGRLGIAQIAHILPKLIIKTHIFILYLGINLAEILKERKNREIIYLVGITNSFWPLYAVPAPQCFLFAYAYPPPLKKK